MSKQITFTESLADAISTSADGSYAVTLLTPGLGASAFYSETVVKRDAPKAFPKGTHVYLTHQRESSGEPSPEKLLGTLVEDTTIRESDGAAVNRFKPLRRHAEFVEDVYQHVGLSISAGGSATIGTIDGRQVKMAESIDYHVSNSVDMVSYPGRAGSGFVESAFARYIEENVQTEPSAPGKQKEESNMELDAKVDNLVESVATLKTLLESALPAAPAKEEVDAEKAIADAVTATRIVESAEVPAEVKDKLVESIKGGNYDVQGEIDAVISLRESLKTELETQFRESGLVIGAAGASGAGATPTVKGWS